MPSQTFYLHFFRQYVLIDPENPDLGWEMSEFVGDFTDCRVSEWNVLHGSKSITLKANGEHYEAWSFELEVTGTISATDVDLELDEEADFSVPAEGGRVNYDASIRNLDSESSSKELKQWSILTLPSGEPYPVHKSNSIEVNYNESKDYADIYLDIPSWFAAGEYELEWFVADPSTGKIISDTLEFTKD